MLHWFNVPSATHNRGCVAVEFGIEIEWRAELFVFIQVEKRGFRDRYSLSEVSSVSKWGVEFSRLSRGKRGHRDQEHGQNSEEIMRAHSRTHTIEFAVQH